MSVDEVERKMCVLMAGRAAGQAFFEVVATGAADGLPKSADIRLAARRVRPAAASVAGQPASAFPKEQRATVSMRDALEAEWLHLTREALPALAKTGRWPIRLDHCWQRVLLDNACGGVWYAHISERPAYKAASSEILGKAVDLGREISRGDADPAALNRRSLDWRGK